MKKTPKSKRCHNIVKSKPCNAKLICRYCADLERVRTHVRETKTSGKFTILNARIALYKDKSPILWLILDKYYDEVMFDPADAEGVHIWGKVGQNKSSKRQPWDPQQVFFPYNNRMKFTHAKRYCKDEDGKDRIDHGTMVCPMTSCITQKPIPKYNGSKKSGRFIIDQMSVHTPNMIILKIYQWIGTKDLDRNKNKKLYENIFTQAPEVQVKALKDFNDRNYTRTNDAEVQIRPEDLIGTTIDGVITENNGFKIYKHFEGTKTFTKIVHGRMKVFEFDQLFCTD